MARKTVAEVQAEMKKLEAELKAAKEKEDCRKSEKRYIEASKKIMFVVIMLVFTVFLTCLYVVLRTYDTVLAQGTLEQAVWFSAPVLTALIAKSGFENVRKGKIRERIIESKLNNNEIVDFGAEDFRDSV